VKKSLSIVASFSVGVVLSRIELRTEVRAVGADYTRGSCNYNYLARIFLTGAYCEVMSFPLLPKREHSAPHPIV